MQRRLTTAFVALAIAAVALVGIGVLAMIQVGARADARARVSNQLDAVIEVADSATDRENAGRALGRIGNAFNVDVLLIVSIDRDGRLATLQDGQPVDLDLFDADQLAILESGAPLEFDNGSQVFALQQIDTDFGTRRVDRRLGVLIGENVARVPRRATSLFLLSAGIVVLLALAAARWLARRIADPIRSIEAATSAIAQGDLDTRVDVDGDDEIAQLARSVNAMAADLDRSRALEQQFLLSVSHDLRTPLTAISGYAEALVDGAATDSVATGTIIADHADRLSRLVTDLLQLARLDANGFSIDVTSFDAVALSRETAAGFSPAAEAGGIEISIAPQSPDVFVRADRGRTAQILSNLIENALKFAERSIVVGLAEGADSTVTVSVADDGPGIAEADLPHVFDRLYVAEHQPIRGESSSGLGLAIVRELARAMDGGVSADRSPMGGTVIAVTLPAASVDE